MALTETQLKLLKGIRGKLKRGDRTAIANKIGKHREYVSKVLSLSTDTFYDPAVNEAVKIISEREQNAQELLEKVVA